MHLPLPWDNVPGYVPTLGDKCAAAYCYVMFVAGLGMLGLVIVNGCTKCC